MSSIDTLTRDLYKAFSESQSHKPKAYDTQAIVKRVDGDVAWVHIPGGVDETPVRRSINANVGDTVQVRISGGSAFVVGNITSPPTDDSVANSAQYTAQGAKEIAEIAGRSAAKAESYSAEALLSAVKAKNHAAEAKDQADIASNSAISALTQLSVVEDVVGVLTWISEHGSYKLSEDEIISEGKLYFERAGDEYDLVVNPSGAPNISGYYELDAVDEAITNYVSSHLSLNSEGLWIVKDNESYKILVGNDGIKIYDSQGIISTFGESISFSSNRPQYIGGDDAYIIFNPLDSSMRIGGSKVIFGSELSLTTMLDTIDLTDAQINGSWIADVEYIGSVDEENTNIDIDLLIAQLDYDTNDIVPSSVTFTYESGTWNYNGLPIDSSVYGIRAESSAEGDSLHINLKYQTSLHDSISALSGEVESSIQDIYALETVVNGHTETIVAQDFTLTNQGYDIHNLKDLTSEVEGTTRILEGKAVFLESEMKKVTDAIKIDPLEPSITVESGRGSVKIIDGVIDIVGNGNTVARFDSSSLHSRQAEISELTIGYIAPEESTMLGGGFILVARQNGHLSLKRRT